MCTEASDCRSDKYKQNEAGVTVILLYAMVVFVAKLHCVKSDCVWGTLQPNDVTSRASKYNQTEGKKELSLDTKLTRQKNKRTGGEKSEANLNRKKQSAVLSGHNVNKFSHFLKLQ
jgi:hypothetical protein